MNQSPAGTIGILLPEFSPISKKRTFKDLVALYIESDMCSRSAKEFLKRLPPSFGKQKNEVQKPLIAVAGTSIPAKDPHREAVNRFAFNRGWKQPTVEDVLRIADSFSFQGFSSNVTFMVFFHVQVKGYVLGFSRHEGRVIMNTYKSEPREGFFSQNGSFAYRFG